MAGTKQKRKKGPKRNKGIQVVILLGVLFAISFIGYTFYDMYAGEVRAQTAMETTAYKTVAAEVLVVRDETVISGSADGYGVSLAENSQRVGSGDTIALFFATQQQAEDYLQIQRLDHQIERYALFRETPNRTIDVNQLDEQTDTTLKAFLDSVQQGDLSAAYLLQEQLQDQLTTRQSALTGAPESTQTLKQLQQERDKLQNGLKQTGKIVAPAAGYFIPFTDGYESVANYDKVKQLQPKQVAQLLEQELKPSGTYGKLIHAHKWYLVTVLEREQALSLSEGDTVKLLLDGYTEEYISVSVESISTAQDGKTALVFSCSLMNESLSRLRKETVQIVLEEYTGLKVHRDAVRMQDGEKGAYILRGSMINFRRMDVIYEAEDFVIAKRDAETKSNVPHLQQYDDVIVQGRNLYDRKILS